MQPLAPLARRFAFNDRFLDTVTDAFEDHDWLMRHGGTNHAQWLLGHLAATRRWALRELGSKGVDEEPWEQHFGIGAHPSPLSDDISPAMLREAFLKTGQALCAHLQSLDEARAAAPFHKFPDGSGTIEGGMNFLHFHETYHLGQIGLLRRLAGKPGFA